MSKTTKNKKVSEIELKKFRSLHDRVCEHCDGCSLSRCAFAEGYERGTKECLANSSEINKHRTIYGYNQLEFELYFDGYFVGYEKWTDRGWMYSQDSKIWNFTPKYAHTLKVLTPQEN